MPNHSSKPDRPRDINQLAKFLVDKSTGQLPPDPAPIESPPDADAPPKHEKDPAAVSLGRRGGLKGGKARAAKMTAEQRSEVAKKAAAARWRKADG
jgi:hypothetical protein